MSKFIKKVILVLFLFLILFIGILEYFLEEITIDGWLGFLGGYFGVLGAIFTINLENKNKKIEEEENLTSYIKYISQELTPVLEENSIEIIKWYLPISYYDELRIEEFKIEDFDIIDTEIINNNLFAIISNNNFKHILKIKKDINKIQNYIKYLTENFINKDELNKIEWKEFIKCYHSLEEILNTFCQNIQFYIIDTESFNNSSKISLLTYNKGIENTYLELINAINITISKSNITSVDILTCYSYWLVEMNNLLFYMFLKEKTDTIAKVYTYFKTCLSLTNSLIRIHENLRVINLGKYIERKV